jgi:hypothetical protein
LIKLLDFVLKDDENVIGRVAGLELCCERMGEKVLFGLFLIGFYGSVEDGVEIGGGRGCGRGCSLRHGKSSTDELVREDKGAGKPLRQRGNKRCLMPVPVEQTPMLQ